MCHHVRHDRNRQASGSSTGAFFHCQPPCELLIALPGPRHRPQRGASRSPNSPGLCACAPRKLPRPVHGKLRVAPPEIQTIYTLRGRCLRRATLPEPTPSPLRLDNDTGKLTTISPTTMRTLRRIRCDEYAASRQIIWGLITKP